MLVLLSGGDLDLSQDETINMFYIEGLVGQSFTYFLRFNAHRGLG